MGRVSNRIALGWIAGILMGMSTQSFAETQILYKNLRFDLVKIENRDARDQVAEALRQGFYASFQGKPNFRKLIANLQGNGQPRTIRFTSNERDVTGLSQSGAVAVTGWQGPAGVNDMTSDPKSRQNIRIFLRPGLAFWYLASTVWHELLHVTLNVTHHYTTLQGSIDPRFVDEGTWYGWIDRLMLEFPRMLVNPVTGVSEEMYNPDNNPWS